MNLSLLKAKAEKERRKRRALVEAAMEAKRAVWRDHPEVYAEERLGIILTWAQIEIIRSIIVNRRTAVKAHHSLGKTFVAAVALLWWLDCWSAHIGYVTAPTWGQALGLTFKQAKRLAMTNKLPFDILDSGQIRDRDKYRATERYIKALNAESGEGFQGEHTAPILIVVEEAVGVPKYIFEASEGLMTDPNCRILEIFNPTDEATQAGEHTQSPNYNTLSFSALDHPNILAEIKCEPIPFPGAVRLLWLKEMIEAECDQVAYGGLGQARIPPDCFEFYSVADLDGALNGRPIDDSTPMVCYKPTGFFQGRVLGEFPTEASNKVIPRGWLNNLPIFDLRLDHQLQIGIDVARFGDDRTAMFARIGSIALRGKELRKFDTVAIADAAEQFILEVLESLGLDKSLAKKIPVAIDVTGGLGAGPHDILKERGYNVRGINSSESAKDEEQYKNKRSELWFEIRDRAKAGNLDLSRLDPDLRKRLIRELSTPMYKVRSGKKVVEEKDETKKRLDQSPDLADGFNLSFYETPKRVRIKPPGHFGQAAY